MHVRRSIIGLSIGLTFAIGLVAGAAPTVAEVGVSAIAIKAPAKARRHFPVTITWNAAADDHTVFVYSQPKGLPCFASGEDERNYYPPNTILLITEQDNVEGGAGSFSATIKARGARTRICAYLVGFNDVGAPAASATRVVR